MTASGVEFAAPHRYGVDANALALHRKAKFWGIEHQCAYLTAINAISPKERLRNKLPNFSLYRSL